MAKIDKIVEQMQRLANQLVFYNFPTVPAEDEDEINILKFHEAVIDGYNVILHYNKHDYGDHFLETFQVLGKEVPFLPFALICKLAQKFLGDRHLSLVEVMKERRKIYCWTIVRDARGRVKSSPYENEGTDCIYEGLKYSYVSPDKVNFY
jgi:hypothetical protein